MISHAVGKGLPRSRGQLVGRKISVDLPLIRRPYISSSKDEISISLPTRAGAGKKMLLTTTQNGKTQS